VGRVGYDYQNPYPTSGIDFGPKTRQEMGMGRVKPAYPRVWARPIQILERSDHGKGQFNIDTDLWVSGDARSAN
jgi:hypothetical protein